MKTYFSALLLLLTVLCNAQEISREFGKVNIIDITLKEYAKDKNADAVVLYDLGKSYFFNDDVNGFKVIFERSFKIKIFKKSGFKWGEVEIPYYYEGETFENVSDIEAYSYNLENNMIKRDKVDEKSIFDEKTNQYWRKKKFALPNIKEGTVIEVRYKIESPRVFDFRGWEFQSTIPTVYSEYIAKMIPFYEYTYIFQGKDKFDVYETYTENGLKNRLGSIEYNDVVYKCGMKDVPAFNDESYITSYNDYILKIDFQLCKIHQPDGYNREIISTWPKLNTDLLKRSDFGKYCDAAEKAGTKTLNLPELKLKPENEQLEYIVNYVKTNFKWDGLYGYFAYKTLKEFQKEKTGNIGSINLYLAGLLKAAGFDAYPVILSTRKNGKIKSNYPFLHYFDYVIVMIKTNGKILLADATEPMCPYTQIPPRCKNDNGLIVEKNGENWVKLNNSEPSFVNYNFKLSYTQNLDSLNCSVNKNYTLFEAYDFKEDYKDDTEKIKKSLLEKGYNSVDSLKTENYLDPQKNYVVKYLASYPVENIENKLYVTPFLSEPTATNPLKQSTRVYPVDFIYPFGKKFKSIINIPNEYKVEFLPQPLSIDNDQVYIEYQTVQVDKSHLLVTGIYQFKKSVYNPDDYKNVKYYFNEIVKKFNEKVVLVRI
jgi:hypothetical protein